LNGLFVTFDGPSGSGKSTLLVAVQQALNDFNHRTLLTKEPTPRFQPSNEDKFNGQKLFNLLLQDRQIHLEQDVCPALDQGQIVLCDRYIASSLVYQRIDGLSLDFIWSKNCQFLVPDLSILVYASDATLQNRLAQRQGLTRFERPENRRDELAFYLEAAEFLQNQGHQHFYAQNEDGCLEYLVDQVVSTIQGLIHAKTTFAGN